jgi:hypothetical protein
MALYAYTTAIGKMTEGRCGTLEVWRRLAMMQPENAAAVIQPCTPGTPSVSKCIPFGTVNSG